MRVATGKVLCIPTAQVHMDWGSGYRDVEVGVMREIPADVLLGNDLGHLSSFFHMDLSPEAFPVSTQQQAQHLPIGTPDEPILYRAGPLSVAGCEIWTDEFRVDCVSCQQLLLDLLVVFFLSFPGMASKASGARPDSLLMRIVT